MNSRPPYIKHIYWMTEAEKNRLEKELKEMRVKMRSARGVVCTPLDERNKITSVAPETWSETCSRQGSWYKISEKNGLYLVVSSFNLAGYEDKREAVITLSDFIPPRRANLEEKRDMIRDPRFTEEVPVEWPHVGEKEKRITLSWVRKLGSEVRDYDFLFLTHSANHSNFINPRFFIREDKEITPYSIDRSAYLCSCCLELFQVLGNKYSKKLVAPCAGAAIFADLKPDKYLLVKKINSTL